MVSLAFQGWKGSKRAREASDFPLNDWTAFAFDRWMPPEPISPRPFAARNPAQGQRRSAAPERAVDAAPADEPRRSNRDGRESRAPNGDNRRLAADPLPAGPSAAEGIRPGRGAGRPRAETANRPAPALLLAL